MALPLMALAGIPSVVKGISGLFGIGKGNRAARQNQFPIEQVNPLLQKNVALAESMAREGMPQQQYNLAQQGIQRNQAGALTSLSRSANPSAGIASLLRAGNDATLNLNAQDAAARQVNQRFAFGQRGILAGEQNRVFDWNRRRRYLQNAQAISQQLGAGRQNAFGALNDLSQLGAMSAMGGIGGSSTNGISGLSPQGMTPTIVGRYGRNMSLFDTPINSGSMGGYA